jgi:hypothetical protein
MLLHAEQGPAPGGLCTAQTGLPAAGLAQHWQPQCLQLPAVSPTQQSGHMVRKDGKAQSYTRNMHRTSIDMCNAPTWPKIGRVLTICVRMHHNPDHSYRTLIASCTSPSSSPVQGMMLRLLPKAGPVLAAGAAATPLLVLAGVIRGRSAAARTAASRTDSTTPCVSSREGSNTIWPATPQSYS